MAESLSLQREGGIAAFAGVLLLLANPIVAAEPPPTLLTQDMFNRYRGERTCEAGPGYGQIRASLRAEAAAARSARYLQHDDAPEQERRIAADYDRVAQAAAARGCPDVARTFWGYILEDYAGPEHEAIRRRAETALGDLNTTPTRQPQ